MVNNGKLSTGLITIVMPIIVIEVGVLLTNPQILQPLLGNWYGIFLNVALPLIVPLYNYYFPRNPPQPDSQEPQTNFNPLDQIGKAFDLQSKKSLSPEEYEQIKEKYKKEI
jgi:hypothetical protein